jgi:deoxyribose-phosphate aldolase
MLRPDADQRRIEELVREALDHGMAAAVVLPRWVPLVAGLLEGSEVAVCSVVGFPLAHESIPTLRVAASTLVGSGAGELDMVISTGVLLSGRDGAVADEIEAVVGSARAEDPSCVIKVIVEIHLLDDDALRMACSLVEHAGADFVKTTTGFTGGGATPEDVRRLRAIVGNRLSVKASAGIRSLDQAIALVNAGADRLGTSAGAAIAMEWAERGEHAGTL